MELTWNQIRTNALMFSEEWKGDTYERGESQSFYNEFFAVFGVRRRSVARFEEHVRKLDNRSGFIDLFWPAVLLVEHKSAGRNLATAAEEAGEYFDALEENDKPRYQMVCDFQQFRLLDRDTGEQLSFDLEDLHKHVQSFSFILGRQKPIYKVLAPVNIEASKLVGELHDILKELGYRPAKLDQLLVRLVFCLFADHTGIFQPRGIFFDYLESKSGADGLNLGGLLTQLFEILNQEQGERQANLDPDLAQFPYINGDLFADSIPTPHCNAEIRERLIDACKFDWSKISPAIFGSLFQTILNRAERRELGGHFTSEVNILKVIEELCLRNLRGEFSAIVGGRTQRVAALKAFQFKLAKLTFFDPACGCGNFLAVAYREIRRIEISVLLELKKLGEIDLESPSLSRVDVDQFFGIETHSYSARIAETALWMTDHLLNNDLSLQLQTSYQRVPLKKKPTIQIGNALSIRWETVLPPEQCSFVFGNPPFKGAKVQSEEERAQIRTLAELGGQGGTLDYVSGWFLKAGRYSKGRTRIAFVATNSITQGEQVAQLWPLLFDRWKLEISFAHQSFPWKTDNPDTAVVHVVILGLDPREHSPSTKALYRYPSEDSDPIRSEHRWISPYLVPADHLSNPHVVVKETTAPVNSMKKIVTGTKPIDGGYYIFSEDEKQAFLKKEPRAQRFFRPFVGATEFLYNKKRYILYLPDEELSEFSSLNEIKKSISNVRKFRLGEIGNKSKQKRLASPNSLAATPRRFHLTVVPNVPFLVIPEVTSEKRDYVPIGWLSPPVIPSNLVKVSLGASLVDFAFLTSSMHMAWMRIIGGRLENRYRYSIGLVYNNFPLPLDFNPAKVESLAIGVLKARDEFHQLSLDELYDRDNMPAKLRDAHRKLDKTIETSYRKGGFSTDEERVEFLLVMYEGLKAQHTRPEVT